MKYMRFSSFALGLTLCFGTLSVGVIHAETTTITTDPTLLDDLVSYWPLDENTGNSFHDVHGHNDLNSHGVVADPNLGLINGAALYTGEEKNATYIEDALQSGLDFANNFSFSAWIKPAKLGTGDGIILMSKWQHSDNHQYHVYVSDTSIYVLLDDDCSGYTYITKEWHHSMSLNQWHNLILVYTGSLGQVNVYLDGVLLGSRDGFPNSLANCPSTFMLGARQNDLPTSYYFDGLMDEVGIWNRALTPDEVARLYNDGHGLPYTANSTHATSSVAFLPGIMASRLYTDDAGQGEQKRWESVLAGDIAQLGMHEDGTSGSDTLYTRDVIDDIRPVTGLGSFGEAYRGWIDFMNGLVTDGALSEWKTLPYDWRLATDELFLKGKDLGGGNVSYAEVGSVPYLIAELAGLADRSPTGKVTIVAHSNGGLVAKNLIRYLEETQHPLLDKIDTLVLVASPQAGTPKAVREILHGIDMPAQQTLRDVVRFMPGAYGLLPSSHLFELLAEPVVETASNVATLSLMQDMAGTSITTYDDLRKFLTGEIGTRTSAATLGYLHPNLLSATLLASSSAMHEMIDTWTATDSLRVIEVVGTGLWTPRGVAYSAYDRHTSSGDTVPSLRTEWRANNLGDGTVLVASAESGEADETYYFGMNEYNAHEDENRSHMTILSAEPMQELIRSHVFGGSDETPLYMNTTGATHLFPRFELRAYSPVDVHLYRGGEHTGVLAHEPMTDLGRPYEAEIPNSYYEEWTDVKYLGADLPMSVVAVIDGTGNGTFTLELDRYDGTTRTGEYAWTDIPVRPESQGTTTVGTDGTPVLLYDFDGDGDTDAHLAPGDTFEVWQAYDVSFAGLREAILDTEAGKLLEVWFLARVNLAEAFYKKGGKGNVQAAKTLLETIAWSAERQSGKALTADESETIAQIARALRLRL